MRAVPDIAAKFVRAHEGCSLRAYQDSGGVWTVGYGHVGPEIHKGLIVPQAAADQYLNEDLGIAAKRLNGVVDEAVILSLTDNQYAALISFVFNLGADPSWTIWKRLNARKYDQVPGEMSRFVNAGGKKVQGLVNRRAAEVQLWSNGEPGTDNEVLSSAQTRNCPTPPVPGSSGSLVGRCVAYGTGAVASIGVAAQQVSSAVQPYADKSPIVAKVVSVMALLGAGAVVVGLVLSWLKHREEKR
jgi:GH24 family phage-related lysozyme (muramidase)